MAQAELPGRGQGGGPAAPDRPGGGTTPPSSLTTGETVNALKGGRGKKTNQPTTRGPSAQVEPSINHAACRGTPGGQMELPVLWPRGSSKRVLPSQRELRPNYRGR